MSSLLNQSLSSWLEVDTSNWQKKKTALPYSSKKNYINFQWFTCSASRRWLVKLHVLKLAFFRRLSLLEEVTQLKMLGTAFFLRLIFSTAWNAQSKLSCSQLSEMKRELLKKHFMSAILKQRITYRKDTDAIQFNNLPWNSCRHLAEFYKSIAFSMLYLSEILWRQNKMTAPWLKRISLFLSFLMSFKQLSMIVVVS